MIKVRELDSLSPGNPFHEDAFHMGSSIGKNVMVMYEKFDHERQPYIIVVNTETGERIRLTFDDTVRTLG